jgi:hypothetical protein
MIIGRGLLASLFVEDDRDDTVFFASGVSNSLENRPEEFMREENLVTKTLSENLIKFLFISLPVAFMTPQKRKAVMFCIN